MRRTISSEEKKINLDFVFECELCAELLSENLLDLIDRCNTEELLSLISDIQSKLKKKR